MNNERKAFAAGFWGVWGGIAGCCLVPLVLFIIGLAVLVILTTPRH